MKKIMCLVMAVAMIAVLALSFAACDNKDPNHIVVNEVTHSIFYAPQYAAMAMGYFEEEGLTIELSNGQGADNVMTALLTGEADIGLMGAEATIYVKVQGKKDYPVIIGQLTKRDGSFLVAREPIENFDYSNIENSTILMGRQGGMPAMILQYVLNNKGYTNNVNITMDYTIQFAMLAPAFAGGTGDYVPLFEPTASELEQQGKGYIVSAIGQDSGEIPYTCYAVNPSYLKNNSEQLYKFLKAVWRGTEYILSTDSLTVAQKLAPYFEGTSVDLIKKAIDNYVKYDVWMTTPVTSREGMERIQDIMQNAGELTERVAYDDIVNNSIAERVQAELNSNK